MRNTKNSKELQTCWLVVVKYGEILTVFFLVMKYGETKPENPYEGGGIWRDFCLMLSCRVEYGEFIEPEVSYGKIVLLILVMVYFYRSASLLR